MIEAVFTFLQHGLGNFAWWQTLLITLLLTHITIASVTIYLHRSQAHRALDLHPIASHFFRFWLWLTTSMATKEWVAVHRKHHARCETEDDPHSPQTKGIETVFWTGAELYRAEAENEETIRRFSHGTPNDWVERNVYLKFNSWGIVLMLLIDVLVFGVLGITVWAVQMAWIPVTAAGIINGIGHYWGYRNFEAPDASTNISPWGILIGGEELHNNHHTYPTAAKFKVKPYEFDIGWVYICAMQAVGLASVKKTPPKLQLGPVRSTVDANALEALIANRYEIMAGYATDMKAACQREISKLQTSRANLGTGVDGNNNTHIRTLSILQTAKRWLHRDAVNVPDAAKADLLLAREHHPVLDTMTRMRDELAELWNTTHRSKQQLVDDLAAWCKRAEESGIEALEQLALRVRSAVV